MRWGDHTLNALSNAGHLAGLRRHAWERPGPPVSCLRTRLLTRRAGGHSVNEQQILSVTA